MRSLQPSYIMAAAADKKSLITRDFVEHLYHVQGIASVAGIKKQSDLKNLMSRGVMNEVCDLDDAVANEPDVKLALIDYFDGQSSKQELADILIKSVIKEMTWELDEMFDEIVEDAKQDLEATRYGSSVTSISRSEDFGMSNDDFFEYYSNKNFFEA